uniref:Olfactory receptor n=1 Tax=Gadus morhua TaxID=8049 RepID=A0A8C5CEY8_GADMO
MNTSEPLSNWAMQLTLQSLDLPPGQEYPVFVLGTLTYMTILLCNTLVFATIVFTKSLHKPMFLLLLNLPIMDMIGATAFLPQLVTSILTKNRSISYPGCLFQAFVIHFYGAGNFLFLTVMAYDRYVAICLPLRYMSIMNPKTLMRLIIAIWLAEILFYIVLFSLVARFRICRTHIVDIFCNNPAMQKLICDDTKFNNYFGLFFTGVIQGIPLVIVTYTYIQILLTCMMTKQADARGKALQTCGTHLECVPIPEESLCLQRKPHFCYHVPIFFFFNLPILRTYLLLKFLGYYYETTRNKSVRSYFQRPRIADFF